MKIVLGVGAGIAAYKSALLLRLFTEAGHTVRVIPTAASLNFVGAATWEALSGQPATSEIFDAVDEVQHVRVGQEADLVVIAPATADLLARIASGRADDLLTTTILATRAPVLLAPAMHTEMWENAATRANVATLRSRGITVLDPAVGRLTGVDTGPGRLPEPAVIRDAALAAAGAAAGEGDDGAAGGEWAGRRVVVTLGGTREPLDPVRYLGNRSSGKQGLAFARALTALGADVRVIAGSVEVELDQAIPTRRIATALELEAALAEEAPHADAVIMAAAVADFRPARVEGTKIKKRGETGAPVIELVRNPDIIAGLAERFPRGTGPKLVAFAAETGDSQGSPEDYAAAKLERKGVDAICLNDVAEGRAFGQDENRIVVLTADGGRFEAQGSKDEVARRVLEALGEALMAGSPEGEAVGLDWPV
ncbi:bifunctional phosphopantothenoylcysteine decarboxylase/phosphopantothenate--cysteine ligase CoaBC [Falsarthrobacter nasiphocae]|uniref:Coenzyme A biosynthesis bifunctional protein CoaBC n=1 Tax=Falsarthrobacter nasiphocae TaxID=189863 RepID=A0AAE3YIQ1_9MICC|nr:bifunctional phosphopantothenoylcysteine decarboxylase/phosphopantothenate--cysteine ligase CoaBC [Falsarthrobacter nasiphocae]MDR6892992.1 phosphopantothenoylcysteine decarboxylase/phosphopantothenate--cysteine ligase [Falsarthrobacter nasiphocae]